MTDDLDLPTAETAFHRCEQLRHDSPEFAVLLKRYRLAAAALRHFGLIEWQNGRRAAAIDAFRTALALAPEDADLWRDLAYVYDADLDEPRAESCIRLALRFEPRAARAWLLYANLLVRRRANADAEVAFGRALACDPNLADAHFSLGLAYFAQRRVDEAAASLRTAIGAGYAPALGFTALGHVLYLGGEYAECIAAFDGAAALEPLEPGAQRKYVRARVFQAMIDGRLDDAWARDHLAAATDAESIEVILRDGFAVLCAFRHRHAAIAAGRRLLASYPDDPTLGYLLKVAEGEALVRAPVDYIERHFDGFADNFDRQLVAVLSYVVPEALTKLVGEHAPRCPRILDLGCGTGLAGEYLVKLGTELIGVDLSRRMLDKAAARGFYRELVKAEAIAFLAEKRAPFDLIVAADVLIYFGDLVPLFDGVMRSLLPGGVFAFSVETTEEADYKLLTSGRFAHDPRYVRRLSGCGFRTLEERPIAIRLEANRPVAGMLVVLARERNAEAE